MTSNTTDTTEGTLIESKICEERVRNYSTPENDRSYGMAFDDIVAAPVRQLSMLVTEAAQNHENSVIVDFM